MKHFVPEPPMAAPIHTLVQLAAVEDAAARLDHDLGRLVQLTILSPGTADLLPAVAVEDVDLRTGTVTLRLHAGSAREIALGTRAMGVIGEIVLEGAGSGPLLADAHGDPLTPDGDASDLAAELIAAAAPDTRGIGWSLGSLRRSCLSHLAANGVSEDMLASCSGLLPPPSDRPDRRRRLLEQSVVADYWSQLLDAALWSGHIAAATGGSCGVRTDPSFGSFVVRALLR